MEDAIKSALKMIAYSADVVGISGSDSTFASIAAGEFVCCRYAWNFYYSTNDAIHLEQIFVQVVY